MRSSQKQLNKLSGKTLTHHDRAVFVNPPGDTDYWRILLQHNLRPEPGVDLSGHSGFKDKMNYHFMRLLGAAILGSVVATASDAAQGDDPNSVLNNALSGTATTADKTIQQIIRKQLNVQPTIEIRPGYKFNIVVLADMVLTSYEPNL